MKSCLILTSHLEGSDFLKTLDPAGYDGVICADGGLAFWKALPAPFRDIPLHLIGDYDSGSLPTAEEQSRAAAFLRLPAEKDMTDSEAAIDYAVAQGFGRIRVLGGLGGRMDHTMGNLGLLAKYAADPRVEELVFEDGQNRVCLRTPGTFCLEPDARFPYFGLIAYGGPVRGLTVEGAKYPLNGYTLTPDTTLGVSNELAPDAPFAAITHTDGLLLVIRSNDL